MFCRGLTVWRIEQLVGWWQSDVGLEVVADAVHALADAVEGRKLGLAEARVAVARDVVSWQVVQVG